MRCILNLIDSLKHVLKNSGQSLLQGFLLEDVKAVMKSIKEDLQQFISDVVKSRDSKSNFLKYSNLKDMTLDTFHVIREIPPRIKTGFNHFKKEFVEELDRLEDPVDKTVFSMKVLALLASDVAGIVYDLRKGSTIQVHGLKKRTALTDFLLSEIVLRLSQLFVARFLSEIEKNVTNEEDLGKLKFFKKMIMGKQKYAPEQWETTDRGDKAFQLVDSFKNYIMTGKES